MYRTLHPIAAEYTYFLGVRGIFSKIWLVLAIKYLNEYKRIKTEKSMFSMYVLEISREIEQGVYVFVCANVYKEREGGRKLFILRNWFTRLWGAGKSKICRAGQQAGHQRRADVIVSSL